MDDLRDKFDNDTDFLLHVANWLHANARSLNILGSYDDVVDAADSLLNATGYSTDE